MNAIQALQVLQARFGSANWNQWRLYRQPVYDSVRLTPAGVSRMNFFNVALGSADPVSTLAKTLEQTNVRSPSRLGQVVFIATQIRTRAHILAKPRQPTGINNDADLLYTTINDL